MPKNPKLPPIATPLHFYVVILLTLVQAAASYFGLGGGLFGSALGWVVIAVLWVLVGLAWFLFDPRPAK
ncbi:hypothetical protein GCM10011404_33630 [Sphingomonas prati]|uniref:p-aminobenzoyl-glutamate transporter AbgT n=1 Tax=Sphingomonas prati TaxID=1843237 RepID=A0A7W9F4H0_9SPHN|nr:p-aminobenzoyl-glutamate transporter AbgT [Sphingomonas prati]GGE97785.1 hypothetical protein GCM10011404_33630 [Sphingomonas prati]